MSKPVLKKKPKTTAVVGSPEADRLDKETLRALGTAMVSAKGRAPFSIPKKTDEVVKRAQVLNNSRDGAEIELSAMLHAIDENRSWAEYGMSDMAEFAESKLEISPSKARTLANHYRHFVNLGLKPQLFSGENAVNFSKFKQIVKAVNLGLIDKASIVEWLPKLKSGGEGSTTTSRLNADIKALVNSASPEDLTGADPIKKFSLMMKQSELAGFDAVLNTYMEALGTDDASAALSQALMQAASNAIADDQGVSTFKGVAKMMAALATQAPVIPVMIPLSDDYNYDNLGCNPARKIYGNFTDGGVKFCLAASREAAAAHLNLADSAIREFDFSVSPELCPSAEYAGLPETFEKTDTVEVEESPKETIEAPASEEAPIIEETSNNVDHQHAVDDVVVTVSKGKDVLVKILAVDGDTYTVKNVDDKTLEFKHKARGRKIKAKDITGVYVPETGTADVVEDVAGSPDHDDEFIDIDMGADSGDESVEVVAPAGIDTSVLDGKEPKDVLDAVRVIATEVHTAAGPLAAKAIPDYFRSKKLGKKSTMEDLRAGFIFAAEVAESNGVELSIFAGAAE